jgi:hypothetical protein
VRVRGPGRVNSSNGGSTMWDVRLEECAEKGQQKEGDLHVFITEMMARDNQASHR